MATACCARRILAVAGLCLVAGPAVAAAWSMHAKAAMELDDDVSVPAIDATSGQSDVAGVFDAGAEATLLEGARHELGFGYDFHQSIYSDLSDANLQLHTLSLAGLRELSRLELGLDYRFSGARLGGEGFLLENELMWRVKLDEKCATIRMRTGELDWVVGIRG